MMTTSAEPILNDVLIALHRSLLQYLDCAWPWSDEHSEVLKNEVTKLAADQEAIAEELTVYLRDREFPVDFGQFPDFSNLNYVSIDFLLKRLSGDQRQVVAICDAAARDLASDPETGSIARKVAAAELERLQRIEQLSGVRKS
jgi:hypothetical protein